MGSKRDWGALQEAQVADYLEDKGYLVLERNFHCTYGEIDIVALEGECLVLVEVKARRSSRFGMPWEAVNAKKLQKIALSGEMFRVSYSKRLPDAVRIDVVSLYYERGECNVTILRGVS